MPRRYWAKLRARRGPREPATRGVLSVRLSVAGGRERSLATQIGPVPRLRETGGGRGGGDILDAGHACRGHREAGERFPLPAEGRSVLEPQRDPLAAGGG